MKKVLIIAYGFPPIGGIGSLRAVKFSKYLPEYGWEPVILSVQDARSHFMDMSMHQEITHPIRVFRAPAFEPIPHTAAKMATERMGLNPYKKGWIQAVRKIMKKAYLAFYIPDSKAGWIPAAVRKAKKIVESESIDLILATAPPYSSFIIGHLVKKLTGTPLVVDYRDEWSLLQYREIETNAITTRINKAIEKNIIRKVDGVVAVMPHIINDLKNNRFLPNTTISDVINNGFDPEDYHSTKFIGDAAKFTITYTGALYGKTRNPLNFYRAISLFIEKYPEVRNDLLVNIVGTAFQEHMEPIENLNIGDHINFTGFVSHAQSIDYQFSADVLLIIINRQPGSKVWLMGKLFEYLGSGTHILALAPEDSVTAEVIHDCDAGTVVDPDDITMIADTLYALYGKWVQKRLPKGNRASAMKYSRRLQTKNLSLLLNDVLENAHQ